MKKSALFVVSVLLCASAFAQTEYEALKLGQSNKIVGTARYMSMAGAFGALGGDASALKDNPAGLGVYRSGEFSTTLSALTQEADAIWYDMGDYASSDLSLKLNNVTYVASIPLWREKTSGLLQSNFSFGYTRVKNFNRVMSANGVPAASLADFVVGLSDGLSEADLKYVKGGYDPYQNPHIPFLSILAYDSYLIDPVVPSKQWKPVLMGKPDAVGRVMEWGGIGEYMFGWGGNFNNNLFFGTNLNIASLYYDLESTLSEKYPNSEFQLINRMTQSGVGVNLKAGIIYLPTNYLRIGAAFHTPTYYSISEVIKSDLKFRDVPAEGVLKTGIAKTPDEGARQVFNYSSPLKAQLSAAYLFGKKGLIAAEYNYIDYKGMRLSNSDGNRAAFNPENKGMKKVMNHGHVIKLGAEYKPIEKVALRAGYAMMTPATNVAYTEGKSLRLNDVHTNTEYFNDKGTNYFSLGAGYREQGWFLDLSYGLSQIREEYYPYQFNRNDLQAALIATNTHQLTLTVGIKF